MEYRKPRMICLDEAVIGIQGTHDKTLALIIDSKGQYFFVTIAAYESDE
jgi:ABC-type branched-subunit amino acid transport system ATPase component